MAASGPHISISAEYLFHVGGLAVTNSMLTSLIVSGLLIAFALWVRASLKQTTRPTGVQNFAEWLVEGLTSLVHSVTGNKQKTELFFPIAASFFLFIIINNWFGLLPGNHTILLKPSADGSHQLSLAPSGITIQNPVPLAYASETIQIEEAVTPTEISAPTETTPEQLSEPGTAAATTETKTEAKTEGKEKEHKGTPLLRAGTADLNMTVALGLISVAFVQYVGLRYLKLGYLKKYINLSSPIYFAVGILEIILELAKVVSFAFRLFGNIFAGEVLLTVISYIAALIAPMPFYGLEIFVGFIQALVFTMLSIVLFNVATVSHDEH